MYTQVYIIGYTAVFTVHHSLSSATSTCTAGLWQCGVRKHEEGCMDFTCTPQERKQTIQTTIWQNIGWIYRYIPLILDIAPCH